MILKINTRKRKQFHSHPLVARWAAPKGGTPMGDALFSGSGGGISGLEYLSDPENILIAKWVGHYT